MYEVTISRAANVLRNAKVTPGIQKHVTVLNTRNGDILRSGNIKGGMF